MLATLATHVATSVNAAVKYPSGPPLPNARWVNVESMLIAGWVGFSIRPSIALYK